LGNRRPTNLIHSYYDHALDPQQFASMSMSMQPPKMVEQPPRLGLGLGKIITVHVVLVVIVVVAAIATTVATAAMTLNDAGQNPHTLVTIRMTFQCNGPSLCPTLLLFVLLLLILLLKISSVEKLMLKVKIPSQWHSMSVAHATAACASSSARVAIAPEQLMILVPH